MEEPRTEVCRTCLFRGIVTNDIFAELQIDGDNTKLKDILMLCTELQIMAKDSLPKKICNTCLEHLRRAYIFNKTSLQAQNALLHSLVKEKIATTKPIAIKTITINHSGTKSILKKNTHDNNIRTERNIINKADMIDSNNTKLKNDYSNETNLKQVRILPKILTDNILHLSNNQQFELLDMFKTGNVLIANNNQNENNKLLNNFAPESLNGKQMIAHPCTKCTKKFISELHLQKHLEQYHLELKLSSDCSICNVRFDSPEELTNHNLEIHFPSANRSVCEICNKEYRNKYLMVRHKKKMHVPGSSSLCCEGCGRLYSSAAGLQSHQRQCCRRGCSPCRYCAQGFVSRGALRTHQALLHAPPLDRPYSCNFCPKRFSAKKVLLRHQRSRHGTSREVLLCGHCDSKDFGFLSADRLTEHLKKEHQNLAEESEPTPENDLPYVITYYAVKEENEQQEVDMKYDPSSVWVEKVICLDGGWEGVKLEGAVSDSRENTGNTDIDGEQNDTQDDVIWGEDGSNANLSEIQDRITDVGQSDDVNEVVEHSDANIREISENVADFREIDNSFRERDLSDNRSNNQGDNFREIDNSFSERGLSKDGSDNQGDSFRERDLSKDQGEMGDSFREIEDSLGGVPSDSTLTEGSTVKTLKGAEVGVEGVIAITVDGATGRVCCKDSDGREVNRAHTPDRELLPNLNSFLKTSLTTPAKARGKRKKDVEGEDVPDIDKDADPAFTCQICDKSFLRLINLEKHVGQHMGASSLTCVICSYRASDGMDLASHLKACRASQTAQRLACPTCGKKLTTAAGLRYHVQTHSALRRHACPACGRRFLALSGLRAHCRAVHSAARPHRCAACARRFATADHLRKHARSTHHKSREHACRMCGKTFLQSSHVRQHMWVHTGIKPHSCPHCPNQYTASCSLAKHLRRNHWEQQHQKHLAEEEMYRKLLEEEGNPLPETFQMPYFIRDQNVSDTPRNKIRQQNKPYSTNNNNRNGHENTITVDGQMVTIGNGDMVAIEEGDMVTAGGEDTENDCHLEEEDGLEQFEGDRVVIEDMGDGVKVVIVGEEGMENDLGEW